MNEKIKQSYQDKSYIEIMMKLDDSHRQILILAQSHCNKELYMQGIYKWTNETVLGSYFTSATASHYNWAEKN